jgi:hypothetical protein
MNKVYEIGTELFNHGDQANAPKRGVIKGILNGPYFSGYEVEWDNGNKDRLFYCQIDPEYKGNGLTRIVPLAVYKAWRAEQQARILEMIRSGK